MELSQLGLTEWLNEHASKLCLPGQQLARVTVVDRGWYIIRNEAGEVSARATGKFLHSTTSTSDMPCVGDWVVVQYHDSGESASIHAVLSRKSFLRRKSAGKTIEFQMIAANIDTAFIVQSCQYDFNIPRLERYLVMAKEGRVETIIVLTKTDLICEDELNQLILAIRQAGINTKVIPLSNMTGEGLIQLKEILGIGKTYCLLGSSGVGKTTLINALTGQAVLKTGKLSASGEGRHTTVRRQLILLKQGPMFIDTPGMREIGILAANEGIEENFDDIQELALQCRFNNCTHTSEPGCAVLVAIDNGELPQGHYQNFMKLKKESERNEQSYTERRKKDKAFGKLIRSRLKTRGRYRKGKL